MVIGDSDQAHPQGRKGMMCSGCGHAIDDHQEDGTCTVCHLRGWTCPGGRRHEFIDLRVILRRDDPPILVTMPGSTSGRYAAKRVAEVIGMDPDSTEFQLRDAVSRQVIPMDVVILPWDGKAVELIVRRPT